MAENVADFAGLPSCKPLPAFLALYISPLLARILSRAPKEWKGEARMGGATRPRAERVPHLYLTPRSRKTRSYNDIKGCVKTGLVLIAISYNLAYYLPNAYVSFCSRGSERSKTETRAEYLLTGI